MKSLRPLLTQLHKDFLHQDSAAKKVLPSNHDADNKRSCTFSCKPETIGVRLEAMLDILRKVFSICSVFVQDCSGGNVLFSCYVAAYVAGF